jgi:hypothetical protein
MRNSMLLWGLLLFSINLSTKAQSQNVRIQFYDMYKKAVEDKTSIITSDHELYQQALNSGWFDHVKLGMANAEKYKVDSLINETSPLKSVSFDGGGTTCENIRPFSTSDGATYPAGVNTGIAQTGPYYSCLGSQPNPIWYYLKIKKVGDLHITETNSNGADVDFILWGPFSSIDVCNSLSANKVVDCSYSGSGTEYIDINSCNLGEYYILMITNFSNSATNITLKKSSGSAETDNDVLKLATPAVSSATYITNNGFTANWSRVSNASSYTIRIYQNSLLSKTVNSNNSSSDSIVITGLNANKNYTYTITAIGDNLNHFDSDESVPTSVRTYNTAKEIISFKIAGVEANISGDSITATVPYNTNIESIIPIVTVSDYAVYTPIGPQNFNSNAVYIVTAEDGSTKNYIITINKIPVPDLQITAIEIPNTVYADRQSTAIATITNKGTADITGKSWIDRIYMSMDQTFNKTNATLLATSRHSGGLKKDSTYVATFQFTAPADTLNLNRFFVETDVLDSVFESVQDNNVMASNWVKLLPNIINEEEYQILCRFFNTTSGLNWLTKWKISSDRINLANWYGVTFDAGNVTSISLPSNKIKGDFPIVLFTLPKLKQLNLSDNQLTEKIDSTLANLVILESIKTDSLTSLNLGQNYLTGEIPSMVSVFPRLQSLNLENNMLSTIRVPLPKYITNLNIQNQAITVDSVKLSVTPELVLPTICTYNHSSQSFDYHPYFSLLSNGNYIGNINYSGNNYHLYWNNPLGWTYESGQPLVLRQETGLSVGSTSTFKLLFKAGDANVDQQVDILDVQHSLNYLLGDNPQPFNFSAANTYKDTLITVQDIVRTVNIILSSVTDSTTATTIQKSKVANASPNHLYIANNNLVLDAVEPVSAMDVTLNDISDKQIRLMLGNSSFQLITRTLPEGGTRFIVFSPTGNEIKAGKTIIAELYNENVGISSAKLSDKSAKLVSVSLSNNVTTGLGNSSDLDFSVYTIFNRAVVTLPSAVEKLYASLYTIQGVMIDDRTIFDLPLGKYIIDYSSSALNTGVYILKLSAKSQGKVLNGNAKLIISK